MRIFRGRALFALTIAVAATSAGYGQDDPAETIRSLQSEIAANPERLDLVVSLGNNAVRAGQFELAISSFRNVLERIEPDSQGAGDLYLRLGETYRRQGATDASIESLTRARHILPENPVVLGTLAMVLEGAGQKAEAEGAYRAALQADSDNATTMNNLAFLIAENGGNLDEALSLARRAVQLMPDASEVADTAGWIQLKRHAVDDALALFASALAREPDNQSYRSHLLMALGTMPEITPALEEIASQLQSPVSAMTLEQLPGLLKAAVPSPFR
jgi:tetratricopeptide (TPR) repeat protein